MSQQPQQRGRDRFEDYVPVAERLEKFYQTYPEGRIVTSIVEHVAAEGFILMRAEVFRNADDAAPAATGHAFEVRGESYVNKTSFVENCETSAVGRALALLGFEVKRGIASREEMQKTVRHDQRQTVTPIQRDTPGVLINQIFSVAEEVGVTRKALDKTARDEYKQGELEACTETQQKEILARLLAARADIELRADIQSLAAQIDKTEVLYDYIEQEYKGKAKSLADLRGDDLKAVMAWLKGSP